MVSFAIDVFKVAYLYEVVFFSCLVCLFFNVVLIDENSKEHENDENDKNDDGQGDSDSVVVEDGQEHGSACKTFGDSGDSRKEDSVGKSVQQDGGSRKDDNGSRKEDSGAVSYTHLTLPTKA